jgi:hypothetical protein
MEYLVFILIILTVVAFSADWKPRAPARVREERITTNETTQSQSLEDDNIQTRH